MNSQTARRPDNQRSTRSTKAKKYVRQTAHVEARRDGKPLIFGWGGHLSRSEKIRLQRRVIWSMIVLTALLMVVVIIGYWVNINVVTPGLAITSVNGQSVSQSDYRKLLALKAQLEANKLNGPEGLTAQSSDLKKQVDAQQKIIDDTTRQIDSLNKKIQALPAGSSTDRTDLNNQLATARTTVKTAQTQHDTLNAQYQNLTQNTLPQEQQLDNQSQLGNDSAAWLQDDLFIRQWLATQNSTLQARIEPSTNAVNRAMNDFSANFPNKGTYSKFLSDDNVSDADMHAMMALTLRRDNMQTYLSSQISSPAYQVLARSITLSTTGDANNVLAQLKKGADFGKLAKSKSVDTNTNTKGGQLGWLARGQYTEQYATKISGVIDNWIFDPSRRLNEISPVLTENGTYHIVQILNVDPSREIDAVTLKSLQTDALTIWLLSQKALPGVTVTPIDQNMLTDAANMPPGLPAAAPAATPPASDGSGLPTGSSGLPGQP